MVTKLSRYCEGIIEASWLSAIVVVPLFFNVFSNRIFEPDKITLLRSLALVILAAWLVKIVEEGRVRWNFIPPGESRFRALLKIPFIVPVAGLAAVYLLATLLSINPSVSFWGSYQRLQGTYTTLSYMVFFFAVVGNLRRQAQIERLITTVILTSLPISFYGILQHYQVDPIPWGGDVTARIAANMGNSIFLAAYLILVNPFTMVRIIESFRSILQEKQSLTAHTVRATAYVFIAALQLIALYFTGSRGPWLGWMAGSFFLFVLLTLYWRKRELMLGVMLLALMTGAFLVVLNIPNGPLESLRGDPRIARLGHLLNAESDTGRVRVLIWQGASELFRPHQPLEYPDGEKDFFNGLRPLIGYGPESMYVAFNPFYPPELGQLEKRNASPDRSHNETWDSLVMTGVLGLAVYLALFAVIFYHGLKWLGLVSSTKQRNLFLALYTGGGLAGAIGLIAWRGIAYIGIGLPFGMMGGVIVYLTLVALFRHNEALKIDVEPIAALTLIALLAVVVAHFAEINFGIAIVATRTYFWIFSGLLLVVGYILPRHNSIANLEPVEEVQSPMPAFKKAEKSGRMSSSKKKNRTARTVTRQPVEKWPAWLRQALLGGLVGAIILSTLGFDFISNAQGGKTAGAILWSSLVQSRTANSGLSYSIFMLILFTWLISAVVFSTESMKCGENLEGMKIFGGALGISAIASLIFWLWHAGSLASVAGVTAASIDDVVNQVGQYESLLTKYYLFLFILVLGAAAFLPHEWPVKNTRSNWLGPILTPVVLIVTLVLVSFTNLRIIQADIAFKMADPFTRQNSWPAAIEIYQRANRLAPAEDYYYLFLGRAYIEYAKTLTDPAQRDNLMSQAERDLKKAQLINPLNTDHTANLARLNSQWASFSTDPQAGAERARKSSEYFSRAVTLSPNNARLWDEWAILFMELLNQPEEAHSRLTQALKVDPEYDWTYALLGQYTLHTSQNQTDQAAKNQALEQAAAYFYQALRLPNTVGDQTRYNYFLTLGSIYSELGKPEQAIAAYEDAIGLNQAASNQWQVEETIAQLYLQINDRSRALEHLNLALSGAPEDQKGRLQEAINQLQAKS